LASSVLRLVSRLLAEMKLRVRSSSLRRCVFSARSSWAAGGEVGALLGQMRGEVARIHARQHLAGLHGFAGAYQHGLDTALDRGGQHAFRQRLQQA
jgi:hypothetical protein